MPPRAKPGNAILARDVNALARAGEPQAQQAAAAERLKRPRPGAVVWGLYASADPAAATIPVRSVVEIKDASPMTAGDRAVMVAIDLVTDTSAPSAITLQPIAARCGGLVMLTGVAWVDTDGGTGAYADPAVGDTALHVGAAGAYQVLYNDAVNQLALVRFPTGGGVSPEIDTIPRHSHSGNSDGGWPVWVRS